MSSSESPSGDVFDLDRIRGLIELMKEHDLSEVDLRQGDQRISLRRGEEAKSQAMLTSPMMATPPPPAAVPPAAEAPPAEEQEEKNIEYIKSPMVGTFYTRPNPDSESFVKVGDRVNAETTVCIVEAMKMFNEIQAEISGQIVSVLVDNEEPVEFGKPLFKVDTSK